MTPRVFRTTSGTAFPATVLDDGGRDDARMSPMVFDEIHALAADGERLLATGDHIGAWNAFRAALELVPEPFEAWNAAGWLLVAMGTTALATNSFEAALAPLKDAMHCPGTIGNPWVHLLLGRARFEVEDPRAADELARAYMGGGREIFEGLDPKYFALVERVLRPPPGHDRLP